MREYQQEIINYTNINLPTRGTGLYLIDVDGYNELLFINNLPPGQLLIGSVKIFGQDGIPLLPGQNIRIVGNNNEIHTGKISIYYQFSQFQNITVIKKKFIK